MTDALSLATASAADRRQSVSASPVPPYHNHHLPASNSVAEEEDDGEIACICAYSDDDGNTIQCDKCYRWQHILCYYPPPAEVPMGEDEKHFCIDCSHRELDARKATERQRKVLEQRNGINGIKRPQAKSHKKKQKDSPPTVPTPQINGWSADRHSHLHGHERKSASPRDLPPPSKRPKTSHRASNSISQPAGRKRNGTNSLNPRSDSKTPEPDSTPGPIIPFYSEEFLQLFQPQSPQVDTATNLMNNIAITNSLSEWLHDSEAVSTATGGLTQGEIFKRWDGLIEDIPGRPKVDVQTVEDHRFASDGYSPRWARLIVEDQIAPGTFIGELRGRIGQREEYLNDPDSRWPVLRHPEPFVFFHPQLPIYIDARQEGSVFRFVRRSCQPNAELQTIITEQTEYHFCFMATKDILPGEEVTVAWQVPDTVSERIKSSLAHSANFQPNVRDYISTWVSKVLANCGPCACNGQSNCLMAHYDRRGYPQPAENAPIKAIKGRKKRQQVSPIDTSVLTHSRSGSEARKFDRDEDMTDSRSVSGSRGSISRDITPNTHYSGNVSTAGLPEMSEREKKKLQREEEMFRKQEQGTGRKKQKRSSGGSNLNTPSTTTSVRSTPDQGVEKSFANRFKQKQLGHSTKYADAGTSSNRPSFSGGRPSSGKRVSRGGHTTKVPLKDSSSSLVKGPKAVYADASVQCDLDTEGTLADPNAPPRPRKRYISVTQRLLRRCISNNVKHKVNVQLEDVAETDDTAMDIDVAPTTRLDSPTPGALSPKSSPKAGREVEAAPVSPPQLEQPEKPTDSDVVMEEAGTDEPVKAETPTTSHKSSPLPVAASLPTLDSRTVPLQPPTDYSPPPWLSKSSQSESSSDPASDHPSSSPRRPTDMHVQMPPPQANPFAAAENPSTGTPFTTSQQVQSPLSLAGIAPPLFSPSVTAAVTPSPARKKMSLSDYTRRSKARESETGTARDSSPASTSASIPPSTASQIAEVIEKAKEAAASSTNVQESAIIDDDGKENHDFETEQVV